jgi:arginine:pyruvate transaminase
MAARSLTVGSMSKSHAMTGSRLGWVAGPAEVIADLIQLATHTTYGVAGFIQEAALFALEPGPMPSGTWRPPSAGVAIS